eukprot:TRINITY_DN1269_c0_g1_i44.p1 TRINITY_DN1269_c0_g1~~TRINITY_DN1269_c0_g1_i44.p1  ORF type:complete len:111 (+),score=2.27 TRINITY_DN1269_c0_g1_i44:3-335(+)
MIVFFKFDGSLFPRMDHSFTVNQKKVSSKTLSIWLTRLLSGLSFLRTITSERAERLSYIPWSRFCQSIPSDFSFEVGDGLNMPRQLWLEAFRQSELFEFHIEFLMLFQPP